MIGRRERVARRTVGNDGAVGQKTFLVKNCSFGSSNTILEGYKHFLLLCCTLPLSNSSLKLTEIGLKKGLFRWPFSRYHRNVTKASTSNILGPHVEDIWRYIVCTFDRASIVSAIKNFFVKKS